MAPLCSSSSLHSEDLLFLNNDWNCIPNFFFPPTSFFVAILILAHCWISLNFSKCFVFLVTQIIAPSLGGAHPSRAFARFEAVVFLLGRDHLPSQSELSG